MKSGARGVRMSRMVVLTSALVLGTAGFGAAAAGADDGPSGEESSEAPCAPTAVLRLLLGCDEEEALEAAPGDPGKDGPHGTTRGGGGDRGSPLD